MDLPTIILIGVATAALVWSFSKSRARSILSLRIAKNRLVEMAPDLLGLLFIIGLFISIIDEALIQSLLGGASVVSSTLYGALIGTVAIIPAFIAFPLAASLTQMGAHLIAVAAFITTLTMVGVLTAPLEAKAFGWRFTMVRNLVSVGAAISIALAMGVFV